MQAAWSERMMVATSGKTFVIYIFDTRRMGTWRENASKDCCRPCEV
jgi:hypothetical protein